MAVSPAVCLLPPRLSCSPRLRPKGACSPGSVDRQTIQLGFTCIPSQAVAVVAVMSLGVTCYGLTPGIYQKDVAGSVDTANWAMGKIDELCRIP